MYIYITAAHTVQLYCIQIFDTEVAGRDLYNNKTNISYISTLGQLHKDKHKGSDTKQKTKPKLMLT